MLRLHRLFITAFFPFQLFQHVLFKISPDFFIEQLLVPFQRKDVVPFPGNDCRNGLLLAVHGIRRHYHVPQVHQPQQFLRCRYLVCLLFNKFLCQAYPVVIGIHVQGLQGFHFPLFPGLPLRAPAFLPIHRYYALFVDAVPFSRQ